MHEIATLHFTDAASSDEAVVICRAATGTVTLCVSLRHRGDVEVFLSVDDCRKLVHALNTGMEVASKQC